MTPRHETHSDSLSGFQAVTSTDIGTLFLFISNRFFIFPFSLRVTTSIYPVPSICAQDQVR